MQSWRCGDYSLVLGRKTFVMGIVNATPDSFSADGVRGAAAIERALQLVEDGADILDIGGESTRPGAVPVSTEEELSRVLPLVKQLASQVRVPISVDTTKAEVARQVLAAGASIINDISAGTFDSSMLRVLGQHHCGVVLMHLRGSPQSMRASEKQSAEEAAEAHDDVIQEVLGFWRQRVAAAVEAGVAAECICLDAGFGFGKSLDENLELVRRGRELQACGFATLSATSRKSSIGRVLGDVPAEARLFGTAATVAIAIQNGADVVRVHDVKEMAQVARMADAIARRQHATVSRNSVTRLCHRNTFVG